MKCSSVLSLLAFVSILHLTVPSPAVISTGNYIDLLSTMFKQLHDWNTQRGNQTFKIQKFDRSNYLLVKV